MKLALLALVALALVNVTSAAEIWHSDRSAIATPASDPAPTCRLRTDPVHLYVVLAHKDDEATLREAFWSAGVPPGSTVKFYWDTNPAAALARATTAARAHDTSPLVEPPTSDASWAKAQLPACVTTPAL